MVDSLINFFVGLLSNDSTSESSQHALISFIVFFICLVIIVAIIVSLYRAGKIIKEYTRSEYDKEQTQSDYNSKIDETRDEIQKLSNALLKISASVDLSNDRTRRDIQELKQELQSTGYLSNGCSYGQDVCTEVTKLRDDVVGPMQEQVSLLITSKKNEIKQFITKEYHYWMPRGVIDIYSWEVIRERYAEYKSYNGNTFVEGMVTELSQLKRICQVQNCRTEAMQKDRDDIHVHERPHNVSQVLQQHTIDETKEK